MSASRTSSAVRLGVVVLAAVGIAAHTGLWLHAGLTLILVGIAIHLTGGLAARRWWQRRHDHSEAQAHRRFRGHAPPTRPPV